MSSLKISSPKLTLGLDPGVTGALSFFDIEKQRIHKIYDMPVRKPSRHSKTKTIDVYELAILIDSYREDIRLALVEEVGAAPGSGKFKQGVASVFKFGYVSGAACGVLAGNFIPMQYIKPSVWKPMLGLSAAKESSLHYARKQFIHSFEYFERKADHNRAEAAILSKMAGEIFKGEFDDNGFGKPTTQMGT